MRALVAVLFLVPLLGRLAQPADASIALYHQRPEYIWSIKPVAGGAELITLICRACEAGGVVPTNVPLLSVLRDTLGDENPESARITDVWLLSYRRPGIARRLLSAVPFFYWRVGGRQNTRTGTAASPLLDMNSLQHPTASALTQNLLQWTVFDPLSTPVRASTRAFRTNAADNERLHLQEAISYLQEAPANQPDSPLSQTQLHTLIARLELRKTLLGGFVSAQGAAKYGEAASIHYQEIRARNWELLREWADKTGLYFEPLTLAGSHNEYVALWSPRAGVQSLSGTSVAPIWKLLNLKPPSSKQLQQIGTAQIYRRALDKNGNLLPPGSADAYEIDLIPLGIYSLDYPNQPLLMVDFRNHQHLRWRAMTQRSINEVTAGVIGISHFTNWYYYVAADLYDFIASRHGSPMNRAERLDSYSQFRARVALDRDLDPRLRAEARRRIDSLAMNPLESEPEDEMQAASRNFERLEDSAQTGKLPALIDKDRRKELANWDDSKLTTLRQEVFRVVSFGAFGGSTKASGDVVAQLRVTRHAQYQLNFLEHLARQDTRPEVQVDGRRIRASVAELEELLPQVKSDHFRVEARETIARIRSNSEDRELQGRCSEALAAIQNLDESKSTLALEPAVVRASLQK